MSEHTDVSDFSIVDGYLVIAPLSEKTQEIIHALQRELAAALPAASLWLPQDDQLHITFAHIITPEATYPEDKNALYQRLAEPALSALEKLVPRNLNIALEAEGVEAFPPAIIVKWQDDGTYGKLRQKFTETFLLPDNTRRPPAIIHTTIARFRREIPFEDVRNAVASLDPALLANLHEQTTEMRVVHEQKIFMRQHKVLATFPRPTDN